MAIHRHLRRLDRIRLSQSLYFITVCTCERRPILASPETAAVLRREWASARARHGWLIGRYVIMPDHVHFFCAELAKGPKHVLSRFVGAWKEWTAKELGGMGAIRPPVWQPRFFDHLLRADESYAEKWAYVRENPVRAGLVSSWEEWPFSGFVDFDFPRAT